MSSVESQAYELFKRHRFKLRINKFFESKRYETIINLRKQGIRIIHT